MMFFFNILGLGFFIIGVMVAVWTTDQIPGLSEQYFFLISGGIVAGLDILYRQFVVRPKVTKLRQEAPESGDSILKMDMDLIVPISNFGGNLMLLPAWLFGFAWAFLFGFLWQ